tara:strand:+ start:99 stop:464 length:366 start_codon:yes stop_codon:yes gene_type:complete
MSLKKIITASLVLVFTVGCTSAQKASEVAAIKTSVAPYLKMSCQELANEQDDLITAAESAGAQVDSAYQSDKNAELAAWILFAPAALMMDGNQEEAAKLASLKGQLDAVRDAQKVNQCITN